MVAIAKSSLRKSRNETARGETLFAVSILAGNDVVSASYRKKRAISSHVYQGCRNILVIV